MGFVNLVRAGAAVAAGARDGVRGGDNVKDSQVQQLEWMTVVASYAGTWRMRCGEDGSCANGCTNISVAAIVSLRIEDDSRWCLQPWWPEV
ncbi:hypothetical protein DEO72_LG11g2015 [Vigna unguiculata]|uniref:Uncharacterized protein n=1 Tax=Vigna unguiculata TaxID=3917 RepID=A0A4D6NTD0_VIGUN|nr:hypothetical protein DEO72_LG11g2015 [Vigna unguiculata]